MKPWRWDFIWQVQMLHYLFYWMHQLLLGDEGFYLPIMLLILLSTCQDCKWQTAYGKRVIKAKLLLYKCDSWEPLFYESCINWLHEALLQPLFSYLKGKLYANALRKAVFGEFTVFNLTCLNSLGCNCKVVTVNQSVGVLRSRQLASSSLVIL